MAMMNDMAGVVVFRSASNDADGVSAADELEQSEPLSVHYLHARERAERAAAKRAQSIAARHVHQELAQHYAELARRAG
jgi:hypothetical protein